jgi:hypothetical protein
VKVVRTGRNPHLSGAVVSEQSEDLVLVHAEAQVVDRHLLAEGLAQLVDHHGGRAQQRLVHLLRGDRGGGRGPVLLGHLGADILELDAALGEPVGWHDGEVPGLRDADFGEPDLGEVPGEDGVDEDIRKLEVISSTMGKQRVLRGEDTEITTT